MTDIAKDRTWPGKPFWTLRLGPLRARLAIRATLAVAVATALIVVLLVTALMLGKLSLGVGEVLSVLTGQETGFHRTVVLEWRAPRAVMALALGVALGCAGAIFQTITRNPLASPDILGVSTGGFTGYLTMAVLAGGGLALGTVGALVGAFGAAAAIYLLAFRHGVQGYRLIVVGIAVSAVLTSFNTWLITVADLDVAVSAAVWGNGDLTGSDWIATGVVCAAVALLGTVSAVLAPGLRQLDLGDDAAAGLGVGVERLRLILIAIAVTATAVATAVSGPIAFVAFAAPQIARRVMRTPGVPLGGAAVFGALLLLAADLIGQHLVPAALPAGIITVVLGGGYLVWLLIEETRRRR
ncbi:FecCD family ABC transporter permease [Stackebrandtia nassauensis]|uniref:Transport system permease protein n=1 Tax=Stackebrandtia nassauensis (strain DSM 44728 / CIP 108903 / NRRL B-16338 / NBRC 102104 / LLR-40K-21) TaxID=446470 RepID=D3Q7F2_STANL|nr:iron chelate uptake ABC transporter family permease subunit [Stackebrandtia nassauensis]ADD42423.1 transport system permease protein [Stackebrandtia nassauensis DSM 44728]